MKKTCSNCGEAKELTEFHNKKSGKYGVASACRVCASLYMKEHYQNNKDKIVEYKKDYYQNNKEKLLEKVKEYHRKNPHIDREKKAKRRALKKRAISLLCETNRKSIKDIYKQVPEGYHVDHIVPLIGKRGKKRVVCGLHVPWNLEPVPAEENLSKSCYTWPDMWTEEELGV